MHDHLLFNDGSSAPVEEYEDEMLGETRYGFVNRQEGRQIQTDSYVTSERSQNR